MTDQQHPITPPPELVQQWDKECDSRNNSKIDNTFDALQLFASKAARWGSDQELEACIRYFHEYDSSWGESSELISGLRTARRPKPTSLKEQALAAFEHILNHSSAELGADTVRRALELLDE